MKHVNLKYFLIITSDNINKENNNDKTILIEACKCINEDLVEYLVEFEIDINKLSNKN